MKPVLRTLAWAAAVVWAIGVTVVLTRIAGTLETLTSRAEPAAIAAAPASSGPSEVSISLRADRSSGARDASPTAKPEPAEPTPEQDAAQARADAVLAEIIKKGGVDDDSTEALRQAILGMRPEDRMKVLTAFAAAANRGDIVVAPEDYRAILP